MRELDKVLDVNERVFWEGRPKFWPFFLKSFIGSFFGSIFLIFPSFALWVSSGNMPLPAFLIISSFWIIGFLVTFGAPIYSLLVYGKTHYAITNKRVLIQKGVIGRDFDIVDFDQITDAQVNVGLLDKLFGGSSGSIKISTASGGEPEAFNLYQKGQTNFPFTLHNVPNPYEVFKFFKKVSHDVKTDIHYPNEYRPKTNPGYHTGYEPRR